MNPENGFDPEKIIPMMDDFFSEADEHLVAVRNGLIQLEAGAATHRADPGIVEDLFRRFHTLKGLAGMVRLKPAEAMAHGIETYLRALREGQVRLDPASVAVLLDGAKLLEQILTARKEETAFPDIDAPLRQIDSLLEDRASAEAPPSPAAAVDAVLPVLPPGLSEIEAAELEKAVTRGAVAHIFNFTPSKALAEQGVNVNTVRQRLGGLGRLIHAAPRISGTDAISFEFLVAVDQDPAVFADWGKEGLSVQRLPAGSGTAATVGPPETAGQPFPAAPLTPSAVVRVDVTRVDDLMRLVGELVISRARLEQTVKVLRPDMAPVQWRLLQEVGQAIERQLRDLRQGVMRLRMVPIAQVFNRMNFVVRDLAGEIGKKVALRLEGQETELDKFVVERMMDPLLHLVRNAVSHGIETQAERTAKGKPPEGTLRLKAAASGDQVTIVVTDDGRGLDPEQIAARARRTGLLQSVEVPDTDRILAILCSPGFSTQETADRASGRGMGMAVVQETIHELGGTLALDFQPDRGATFTIRLPLTLAIIDALIVEVGGQRFAVPQAAVREVIEIAPDQIVTTQAGELVPHRRSALALVRLAHVFGLGPSALPRCYALVLGSGRAAVGLVVDRVAGRREIVVRPATDPLIQSPGISGATELGDGHAVLIIDPVVFAANDPADWMRNRGVGTGRPDPTMASATVAPESFPHGEDAP